MYFCVNEFEVGFNHSIFAGNEQQKVYYYVFRKRFNNHKSHATRYCKGQRGIAGEQLYAHFLSMITMELMTCVSKLFTKLILMNQQEKKGLGRINSTRLFLRD